MLDLTAMLQVPMGFVNAIASIQHKLKPPLVTSVIAAPLVTIAAFQSYMTHLPLWGNPKEDKTHFMSNTKELYMSGYPRLASKTSFKRRFAGEPIMIIYADSAEAYTSFNHSNEIINSWRSHFIRFF